MRSLVLSLCVVSGFFVAHVFSGLTADAPLANAEEKKVELRYYPVRLLVPSQHIDAYVEPVGAKENGDMATPSNFHNVAWYMMGSAPGERGSAVIAGHVDNALGLAGVFKELKNVRPGDDIYVETAEGKKLRFEVVSSKSYAYNKAPADAIFDDTGPSRLALITCDGDWIKDKKTYDHRLVVTARLVE